MVLAAFMVPHPPLIIPEIGKDEVKTIEKTVKAYESIADEIATLMPDTIVITSPHSVMYADCFHVSPGEKASGSFAKFGAGSVSFSEEYDRELVQKITEISYKDPMATTLGERDASLDHGTLVPLYFIRQKYKEGKIVRIGLSGLSLPMHYEMGQIIQQAVERTGVRAVYVASGDLSHKMKEDGPYGFAKEGPEYDERIMEVCGSGEFDRLLDFDETFCDKAAECGHRSFVMMAGALDGLAVTAHKLSHEATFGVGYGICTFRPGEPDENRHFLARYLRQQEEEMEKKRQREDPLVRLARLTVESYVRTGSVPKIPDWATDEMKIQRAGVFVSIHEHGRLRGCIGTILPVRSCIAEEILHNAVSAASEDPRFDPIQPEELPYLEISVDVLTKPERISGPQELDVKRYGVIVSCGRRRGLLLPDLDGVDTVEEQISIARSKGGISEREPVVLERFEVIRHH